MNEQQYRDVLLAKAIETAPADQTPLVPPEALRAATEQALYEGRGAKGGDTRRLEALTIRRAERVLQHASRHHPQIEALRAPRHRASQWLWWLPLAALLLGFASEKVSEPHRLNLITLPLLAIVAWNLLMYGTMLVRAVLRARLRAPRAAGDDAAPAAVVSGWWSRSTLALKDADTRAIHQRFLQDWAPYSHARQSRMLQAMLHVCAATLALGVALGLWVTGLFTEYRVGWESTWLDAPQMQWLANLLTWPAQQLLGQPAWTLAQIEALQTWPAGNQHQGQQWIIAYSLLLVVIVVLPRTLLAAWQVVRAVGLSSSLHLPLAAPYFQRLARDFSSDSTVVLIHPFSMAMNAEREQHLRAFVQQQLGAAAHLHIAPGLAYGDPAATGGGYFRRTLEERVPSLSVLLFNLAATPEEEAHGAVMRQFDEHVQGARAVWLYGQEFAQRLGSGEAARQRLAERRHLWQLFVESHGLQATFTAPLDAAKGAA